MAPGLVGDNDFGPLVNTAMGTATPHDVDFRNSTFVTLPSLTAEIGAQLSQLPLASPVSGFVFNFKSSLGVVSEVTQNFGERFANHRLITGRRNGEGWDSSQMTDLPLVGQPIG